mmetsp:Transcript_36417/g.47788  ORF Transcript_36417/g.47788 Transcript_36417/m.47788 type:complete len:93 (+) Transcript_36417:838-1116(+)
MMIILDLYCLFNEEIAKTFPGFFPDRRLFDNFWPFLKVGIPGTIMQGLRWWAMELIVLVGGMLEDAPSTSAASITMCVWAVFNCIVMGLAYV